VPGRARPRHVGLDGPGLGADVDQPKYVAGGLPHLGDGDGGTSVLDRFHLVSHVHVRLALDAAALHRVT
jgi:hypothetical protein